MPLEAAGSSRCRLQGRPDLLGGGDLIAQQVGVLDNRKLVSHQAKSYALLFPKHFELRSLTWVSLWAIVVSKPIFWTAQRNQASECAPNSIQVLGRDLISMARRVQVSAKPLPHSLSWSCSSESVQFIT